MSIWLLYFTAFHKLRREEQSHSYGPLLKLSQLEHNEAAHIEIQGLELFIVGAIGPTINITSHFLGQSRTSNIYLDYLQ